MTVLVVEDDPLVAQVNAGYLAERTGYRVCGMAATKREGAAMLRHESPDVLLLDVFLPDGSGLDLLAEARAEGWGGDVVMLTAARDAASVQTALQHGVTDFLIKPFTRERLYQALDTLEERQTAMQGGEREFTQQALDKLLSTHHPAAQAAPKRTDSGTLERVLRALQAATEPLSAEQVGSELGMNRATAWRYLEQLVGSGQAEVVVEYGGVGRPTKRYQSA